jgi:hypothetical protein
MGAISMAITGFTRRHIAFRHIAFRFVALVLLFPVALLVTLSATKFPLGRSPQEKPKKALPLRWDPPRVDARIPSLSATPPCSLTDVQKQAGQRAQELVDHLQRVIAHDQVRYEQTGKSDMASPPVTGTVPVNTGQTDISGAASFDYIVDFGENSGPLNFREHRTRLAGTDDGNLSAFLDRGLPVLALIFHPALQSDYEMRCEGIAQWNNHPAWVVHFRQLKEKLPRTLTMETSTQPYQLSLKGRAWIAEDSGQVMHLETNLVDGIIGIDLQQIAISVDYAPIKSQSQNVEIWLPVFVEAYTEFTKRGIIVEHTFSDFQLFSVQTQERIQKPTP